MQLDGTRVLPAVLDVAPVAFVGVDDTGRVVAWNPAAERLFGYTTAEALGRPVATLIVPPRCHAPFDRMLARLAAGEPVPPSMPGLAVDAAGREIRLDLSPHTTVDAQGTVIGAFLSERPAPAGEQQEFLKALLDSLDTGVVACDASGRLNLFNQALREIHGMDAGPVGRERWSQSYDLYAEDGHPLAPHEVPLARAYSGETVTGQHMVVRPAGRPPRRFVANGKPIVGADGRHLGAVVAMHEITEQYRAARLHQAQHAVTAALAEAVSATAAAAGAVAAITNTLGWARGQFWHHDEDTHALSCDAPGDSAWAAGIAATVARSIAQQWAAAEPAGLGTVIGVPVCAGDRLLGVLCFATGDRQTPDDTLVAMLDAASAHLGRFVERRRLEDLTLALAAARSDFARVIDRVNDYVWTVELLDGGAVRSVFASPDGTGVFGAVLPTDADMAVELATRMDPDDLPAFTRFHERISAERPAEIECRIRGYDGVTRWVWTRAIPRREGDRLFADGISTNVTERHRLGERLEAAARAAHESELLLTAVAAVGRRVRSGEDARAIIMTAIGQLAGADYVSLIEPAPDNPGAELVVTAADGAAFTGTRIPLDDTSLTARVYREGRPVFVADITTDDRVSRHLSKRVDASSVLWQPVTADDTVIAVLTASWRQRLDSVGDHRTRAVALLADETALALVHERLLHRLEQMAHTDTLTGLANRRTWQAELPRLFARARRNNEPLTVAIADLDHFKRYNDTHGHPAGDDLLHRAATAFTGVLRDGDLIVRWGGEEFAITLVDCGADDAAEVLDRVRTATPGDQTCSIGHATWDGQETMEQLLARADTALYAAKTGGRNTVRAATAPPR
ncbi:diguanylate cyclase domain-containing protein [Actinoplanes sp. CA-054009]